MNSKTAGEGGGAGSQKIHMLSKDPAPVTHREKNVPFERGPGYQHRIRVMELISNKVGAADIMTSSALKWCQKPLKPNQPKP